MQNDVALHDNAARWSRPAYDGPDVAKRQCLELPGFEVDHSTEGKPRGKRPQILPH